VSGVNKAILIGNVGRDPDIREGKSGKWATFSLATNETWKDKSGEKHERVEWHQIVVNGPLVSVIENYVGKGDRLYIEGKITYRKDEDGKRVFTNIQIGHPGSQLVMLSGTSTASRHDEDDSDDTYDDDDTSDSSDVSDDDVPF
jgi:single-strand DNA-binding protein